MIVLAVNLGDSADKVKKYFEKNSFTMKPVLQKKDEISTAYGVQAYPTNYVVGPDGKIAHRSVSYQEEALRTALDKLAPKK